MMYESTKLIGSPAVRVKRVKAGDVEVAPVGFSGFVSARVPSDGFIVFASHETVSSIPIYIRDDDMEKARQGANKRGAPIVVDAQSWAGIVNGEEAHDHE